MVFDFSKVGKWYRHKIVATDEGEKELEEADKAGREAGHIMTGRQPSFYFEATVLVLKKLGIKAALPTFDYHWTKQFRFFYKTLIMEKFLCAVGNPNNVLKTYVTFDSLREVQRSQVEVNQVGRLIAYYIHVNPTFIRNTYQGYVKGYSTSDNSRSDMPIRTKENLGKWNCLRALLKNQMS